MRRLYTCLLVGLLAVSSASAALVAHWDFSDGTYNDKAGSLDGAANGSVAIVDSGSLHFAKAVQTGSAKGTDYLNVGDLGTLGIYTNSFTVSLWIHHASSLTTDEFWDSMSGSSSVGYEGIAASVRASNASDANKVYMNVGDGSTAKALLKNAQVSDGAWHWVVVRYDAGTGELKYFEDGVHIAGEDEVKYGCSLVREDGRDLWLGDGFGGMIGDVRIYDTALSFTENGEGAVVGGELYGLYGSPLVAHWDFSDGTYEDQAGSLDGTANGSVSIVDSGSPYFAKAVQTGSTKGTDYLNVGDLGTLGIYTNSFTVSLWVNHASSSTTDEFWDSLSGTSTSGYEGIKGSIRAYNVSNADKVYMNVGNGSTTMALLKGAVVSDGEWHWLVIRYDSETGELKYFEDSVHIVAEDEINGSCSLVQEAGRNLWLGDGFGGMIGDVRIYNKALSFTTDENNELVGGDLYEIYTGSEEDAVDFSGWLNMYPTLGTSTNYTDDPDADGMNNLLEYALGGIPTDSDAVDVLPTSFAESNWMLYVYNRRLDASSRQLSYSVVSGADLTLEAMTNATEEIGSSVIDAGFEVVTNRVPMDLEPRQFVTLKIEVAE
ncbi:LamG domain-containing protein [Tichowtungia aerotolerans]|uniref:LamG domain-containing protein n=1 Tax=Tichowtungia aerotolerans TaxID=2697043 RepID=A0A6P1MCS9_9BACT|nr:LamG domain-containing protein [Tichowtungia aerotolerans]QHI69406.1 hypothetical protein GT409_08050 [Tichowtungia aerotolerans]